MLNTAVVAPTPSAIVMTEMAVNVGTLDQGADGKADVLQHVAHVVTLGSRLGCSSSRCSLPLARIGVFTYLCATCVRVVVSPRRYSSAAGGPPLRATWSARIFPESNRRALAIILSIVSSKSAVGLRWNRSGLMRATTNALRYGLSRPRSLSRLHRLVHRSLSSSSFSARSRASIERLRQLRGEELVAALEHRMVRAAGEAAVLLVAEAERDERGLLELGRELALRPVVERGERLGQPRPPRARARAGCAPSRC